MAKRYITPEDIGAAHDTHEHDAGDVTSGALAPARLATGTPAAGMYPDGAGAWTNLPAIPTDYISGLRVVYDSASQVSVESGSAYVPGLGGILEVSSALTAPLSGLTSNAWHYLYVYDNAGTPALEISTTVPVDYHGTAKTKTGDDTRRYVGAIFALSATTMRRFAHHPEAGFWRNLAAAWGTAPDAQQVLGNTVQTTETALSLADFLPPTARLVMITAETNRTSSSNGSAYISSSEAPGDTTQTTVGWVDANSTRAQMVAWARTNASRQITYQTDTAISVAIYATAYYEGR